MRAGAADYLAKPWDDQRLIASRTQRAHASFGRHHQQVSGGQCGDHRHQLRLATPTMSHHCDIAECGGVVDLHTGDPSCLAATREACVR